MSRNIVWGTCLVLIATLAGPPVASADQTVSLGIGLFSLRGEDARVQRDVLIANLHTLAFELRDFRSASLNGEWLVGLGGHLEAGVGLGYYRRTVPTVYRDLVHRNGSEIEQDLRLRIVPVSATVRLLPLGRSSGVQPYLGAGVVLLRWRYSEVGEFVDTVDRSIFRDRFVAQGSETGPLVVGGVRVPLGGRLAVGGELRYQSAAGTVGVDNGFLDEKIDLSGLTSQITLQLRFD